MTTPLGEVMGTNVVMADDVPLIAAVLRGEQP